MAPEYRRSKVGKLKSYQKRAIYIVSTGVWLSGIVWLYFYYFVRVIDQFGFENPHPKQRVVMWVHAVFALLSVWIFGYLWTFHIRTGWMARSKRFSGGAIWSTVLVLSLTGYALYYIGDAVLRNWISMLHWISGIAAMLVFFLHLRRLARWPVINRVFRLMK